METAYEHLSLRRHGAGGPVAELVLDRPAAHNALSTAMARELAAATAALAADPGVVVVVLSSSAPRAFSVGADLKERHGYSDADLLAQRPVFRAAFSGVLELPAPSVAAVHGFALGGGFELALSCDLLVADATAVVGLPEVTVGVVPGGGGTQLLPRRVGGGRGAGRGGDRRGGRGGRAPGPPSTGWSRPGRRAPPRWSWPGRSRPTPRSGCATPSAPCAWGPASPWAPRSRSRTPRGGPRPSPRTAGRASRRSPPSGPRGGRDGEPRRCGAPRRRCPARGPGQAGAGRYTSVTARSPGPPQPGRG